MKIIALFSLAVLCIAPSFSQTMEWHIKDSYVDVKYMGNDLFKVKNHTGKWGVVNEYGKLTVPLQYDSITNFVEERALLLDATGHFLKGIINRSGQIIKSFDSDVYINYQYFSDGMLAYAVPNGNYYLFGYVDVNGNSVIRPKYLWATPFYNGIAAVHYTSQNFGLINKAGATALNDNRKLKFISNPVNNMLLIAVSSTRGDKVLLVKMSPNGRLEDVRELETLTVVNRGNDYSSLSCNNGRTYYFDNAMRLLSSSSGETFNKPLAFDFSPKASPDLKKVLENRQWSILYAGSSLLKESFRNITFCDNKYAIVNTATGKAGVLKINPNGYIAVKSSPATAEFYHNAPAEGNLEVSIGGLYPSSRVQIGVIGLNGNTETRYNVDEGFEGVYTQPVSYFIPSGSGKVEGKESMSLTINFYIDGMLYKTETAVLAAVHKRGFNISEAVANEFSEPDGSAKITFNVQSLKSSPSSSAVVTVRGDSGTLQQKFSGNDLVRFSVPVMVPFEEEKTFSFTITVKEEGCPTLTKTITKTVKHYNLQ